VIWRATINGHEAAIVKLRELAAKISNELQVLHLPTKSLIATMNQSPHRPNVLETSAFQGHGVIAPDKS
jgi:hypothetical protein